jgi:hypothetical protein
MAPVLQPRRTGRIADGNTPPVIAGLAVAWSGTALLISPVARSLDDPSRLVDALIGQGLFWAIAAALIASVLVWEKQPIQSILVAEISLAVGCVGDRSDGRLLCCALSVWRLGAAFGWTAGIRCGYGRGDTISRLVPNDRGCRGRRW